MGAALGGALRYWVSGWAARPGAETFPWGTMLVNVTGSLLIGFFAAWTGPEGRVMVTPQTRLLVMTGVCGGYTTFSTFSLETLRLMQDREWGFAAMNVAGSVVLCLAGVWAGHWLANGLNQR